MQGGKEGRQRGRGERKEEERGGEGGGGVRERQKGRGGERGGGRGEVAAGELTGKHNMFKWLSATVMDYCFSRNSGPHGCYVLYSHGFFFFFRLLCNSHQ